MQETFLIRNASSELRRRVLHFFHAVPEEDYERLATNYATLAKQSLDFQDAIGKELRHVHEELENLKLSYVSLNTEAVKLLFHCRKLDIESTS